MPPKRHPGFPEIDRSVEAPLDASYNLVREFTEKLTSPLSPEDQTVQSMPDASPTKWHLAHTTWFFETFVLEKNAAGYRPFHPRYGYLFNSYYNAIGDRHPRPQRGLLTRPSLSEVQEYRKYVDEAMRRLMERPMDLDVSNAVRLGLHHEQQHQELILTDIKHLLSLNLLRPMYRTLSNRPNPAPPPLTWVACDAGVREIGHGGNGFAFDNESPRHPAYVHGFRLGSRLVTNGEFLEFMRDGGYRRPGLWLSDGFGAVQTHGWTAPLYWEGEGNTFTLGGVRPIDPHEPVCHVSYYEADAFARWAGARLPTEGEWETVAAPRPVEGNFVDDETFHPTGVRPHPAGVVQLFGDVWEWTASPYVAYPGFHPAAGALGEYNGKFMCNQMVLRGGSCATSRSHTRATYRNFFPPETRWQFSGIRLANDA